MASLAAAVTPAQEPWTDLWGRSSWCSLDSNTAWQADLKIAQDLYTSFTSLLTCFESDFCSKCHKPFIILDHPPTNNQHGFKGIPRTFESILAYQIQAPGVQRSAAQRCEDVAWEWEKVDVIPWCQTPSHAHGVLHPCCCTTGTPKDSGTGATGSPGASLDSE